MNIWTTKSKLLFIILERTTPPRSSTNEGSSVAKTRKRPMTTTDSLVINKNTRPHKWERKTQARYLKDGYTVFIYVFMCMHV